jgi:hypothetical protein
VHFCDFWPKNFFTKNYLYRGNFTREIDCAHSRSIKTLPWPWFREWSWYTGKKRKFSIFASIHQLHFLNQGRDNFFMLRKCAQSIPRIKLPLDAFRAKIEFVWFSRQYTESIPWTRVRKCFHFSLKTLPCPCISLFSLQYKHLFPESRSGKHYQSYVMRVIDSSHRKTPYRVILLKIKKLDKI